MIEKISKNHIKGNLITNPLDLMDLAENKKSVFVENRWGIKPSAVILSMQFRIVMKLIKEKRIYHIIKTERNYGQRD